MTPTRRMVILVAVVLSVAAGAGYIVRVHTGSSSVVAVPATIPGDCSRPVEVDLNRLFRSVKDGSTVLFPPKRCYAQDRTIVVADRRNITIDGHGSTFKRITPPNPTQPPAPNTANASWRIIRGDGVTMQDMTIRGNYVPAPRGTSGQGQYTDQGVSIWGGMNDSIRNLTISNTDGEFIEADPDVDIARARFGGDYSKVAPSRNIVVDRLRGEHASRQCVAATAVDGFVISNSYLDDCQQTGIDIEIDVAGELARNIHLMNNTFGGTYFAAISIPVLALPGVEGQVADIEIRHNTMTTAPDTCYSSILVGADGRGRLDGLIIADNTLLTLGDGVSFGGPNIYGAITDNVITKTAHNTGCDNPNFTPPHTTPIRLRGATPVVAGNVYNGY